MTLILSLTSPTGADKVDLSGLGLTGISATPTQTDELEVKYFSSSDVTRIKDSLGNSDFILKLRAIIPRHLVVLILSFSMAVAAEVVQAQTSQAQVLLIHW